MPAFESIVLSPEKVKDITRFGSFGQDWIERSIRFAKAKQYVEENLNLLREESKWTTPFRCCDEGDEVYCRKDGNPVTQDDIDALSALVKGQETYVKGKAGDMKVTQHWFCDHGD